MSADLIVGDNEFQRIDAVNESDLSAKDSRWTIYGWWAVEQRGSFRLIYILYFVLNTFYVLSPPWGLVWA